MKLQAHWDQAYLAREIDELGWYEEESKPSLDLIKSCNLSLDSKILNVGAGTSTLIDSLLELGYQDIIATDISQIAIDQLQERLSEFDGSVTYINDDLTRPSKLLSIDKVDLWHDRAVLHFLTASRDQETYFELLKKLVKVKGYVILAEFELENGAQKCCNLDVQRYDITMLSNKLGSGFQLVNSFSYDYTNPRGENRPYIYTLFQRTG